MRFLTDRKFGAEAERILDHANASVEVKKIFSGKLRRYHGVSLARQLLDIPELLKNIRDVFLVGVGALQSTYYILRWRPDVVFTKGGFVCLPVGLAAALLRVPIVVHDSDAHPGLTNRILARFARRIATGAPLENYQYPRAKSTYVGIPVGGGFKPFDKQAVSKAKAELGFSDTTKPLVVVTGGGLGARQVNMAVLMVADSLAENASVLHITGKQHSESVASRAPTTGDYKVVPFVHKGMHDALGAANVVVTRAGATTLAELALLAKPTIIIPNAMLTGGHQTKNASVYKNAQAAEVLEERDIEASPTLLLETILHILRNKDYAKKLSGNMQKFAKPDAAIDTARLIVSAVNKTSNNKNV